MKASFKKQIAVAAAKLEEIIGNMETEQERLEAKASDGDSGEMTEKESEQWDELEEAKDACQNALDYISDYVEEDL